MVSALAAVAHGGCYVSALAAVAHGGCYVSALAAVAHGGCYVSALAAVAHGEGFATLRPEITRNHKKSLTVNQKSPRNHMSEIRKYPHYLRMRGYYTCIQCRKTCHRQGL